MLPDVELHAQAAGFERAVGQEILNELLQALSAGLHVAAALRAGGR